MDFFAIIILFVVGNLVVQFLRRIGQTSKQAATQAQIEATKRTGGPSPIQNPVPQPMAKPADFRFPPVKNTTSAQPVFVEGRKADDAVRSDLSDYKPAAPSADLNIAFSNYKGSLETAPFEGIGYTPEAFDDVSSAYQTSTKVDAKILPDAFNRNALIQAVVMSEILKRPGESRR